MRWLIVALLFAGCAPYQPTLDRPGYRMVKLVDSNATQIDAFWWKALQRCDVRIVYDVNYVLWIRGAAPGNCDVQP